MSDSEFDIIPDPFTSVTDAEWSRLLGRTNLDHDLIIDASPARSTTSTHYSDENLIDMNMSALAELDRIEASALQSPRRPSPQGASLFYTWWVLQEPQLQYRPPNCPIWQSRWASICIIWFSSCSLKPGGVLLLPLLLYAVMARIMRRT